jgi:NTP pyrophosphatase (non-canonical NTP hydrolase)
MPKSLEKRMDLQNAEFDALRQLVKDFRRLEMTPVVDDDYPEMRHYYESALHALVDALNANRANHDRVLVNIGAHPDARSEIPAHHSLVHIAQVNHARALKWHKAGLKSWSNSDWFTALAGECGELGNVIKKMNRVRDGMPARQKSPAELAVDMQMEIGDTFIYLDLLAQVNGWMLAECIKATFNRISEREGFPERL